MQIPCQPGESNLNYCFNYVFPYYCLQYSVTELVILATYWYFSQFIGKIIKMSDRRSVQPIIGESPAFLEMLEHVSRAAELSKPVLVVGERGTGKELIASRLHFLSPRWEKPLIKVNCAALTESILESELFGHESGAFTGAIREHVGHFERADEGTLVLDELANISLRMQEKNSAGDRIR